jgi:hypothetical protein
MMASYWSDIPDDADVPVRVAIKASDADPRSTHVIQSIGKIEFVG